MKRYLFIVALLMPLFLFAQDRPEIILKRNTKGLVTFKVSLVNKGPLEIDWGNGEKKSYDVNDESKINDATVISEEVKKSTTIKIYAKGIKVFSCFDQFLTFLDVSAAPDLVTLDCGKNILRNINVSANKNLRSLMASDVRLSVLDVSANKRLTYLNCSYNYLKTINLTNNINLSNLNISDNLLDQLDLSKQKSLRTLNLSGNRFRQLEVKGFTEIKFLDVTYNKLDACALNELYAHLPNNVVEEQAPEKKINLLIANNRGLVSSETSIAVQKGWNVDVEGKGSGNCL